MRRLRKQFKKITNTNPPLLALALIIMLAALIIYFVWNNVAACTGASIVLQLVALAITARCLIKEKGPFEIMAFGLTFIVFVLCALCLVFQPVHDSVENTLGFLFLDRWDWVALIVAIASLVFAACTWISQERTQHNTMRISPETQLGIFIDYLRDTYRNICVVYALDLRLRGQFDKYYPSEDHLKKLCIDEDSIYTTTFVDNSDKCGDLHRFKINARNANIEYGVITTHLLNKNLPVNIKEDDIQKLKERLEYTVKRLVKTIESVWGIKPEELAPMALKVVKPKAADKNKDSEKYKECYAEYDASLNRQPLYDVDNSEYLKVLFPEGDSDERSEFIHRLNQNIYAEAHIPGLIRLIPFA
ncbi:MAG: hypothetical protein K2F77_02505 [Muribaculaceae bacterium]|nr:hypothetical protein [Muribaculaceae bacterium]